VHGLIFEAVKPLSSKKYVVSWQLTVVANAFNCFSLDVATLQNSYKLLTSWAEAHPTKEVWLKTGQKFRSGSKQGPQD